MKGPKALVEELRKHLMRRAAEFDGPPDWKKGWRAGYRQALYDLEREWLDFGGKDGGRAEF